jgi:signal transduction histidine kinase
MREVEMISLGDGAPSSLPTFEISGCESFRDNELLAGISDQAYAEIEKRIEVIRCQPHQVIFEENEAGDSLYLIGQGSVRISKKGRGGQQETLTHLMEKDFFGEMALVDNGRRSAQAAAAGSVVVGRIDRATWDLLLRVAPHEVLGNFTRAVTKRLRHNNQHFIEQMMRNERMSLLGTTISSIVHDMNNPIGCILNACDVVRSKSQDDLTEQMTRIIRDSVKSMEMMTREMIDFSRGKTHLHLESVGVADLLQGLERDFAKCGPFIDVRVEVLYHGKLQVDRHRLLRVFSNLIRNAREAMKAKEGNQLRFLVRRLNENIRFEISDTGGGIPSDLLPRIFEPFTTHGKANGTGLGLAIAKSVVDAHGGTILALSDEKGTSFQIDLPLEPAARN